MGRAKKEDKKIIRARLRSNRRLGVSHQNGDLAYKSTREADFQGIARRETNFLLLS
jgi:hypothetical protein